MACAAWVVLAALLTLLTFVDLVASIANAHHDPHFNRSPGALIAIAVLGVAAAIGALSGAIGTMPRRSAPIGTRTGVALTAITVLLILLYAVTSILSGPL